MKGVTPSFIELLRHRISRRQLVSKRQIVLFTKRNEIIVQFYSLFFFMHSLQYLDIVLSEIKDTSESAPFSLGGAMVLGKLPGPGRPTIRMTVGQGPTALPVGAGGGGCLEFLLSSLSLGDGPI